MPNSTSPKLFALLIGIDRYSQKPLSGGIYYPSLGGCVRDINQVEEMLKNRLKLPLSRITKLVSVNEDGSQTANGGSTLPTYENIVNTFKNVTKRAEKGDQVYIHYSGHGGRCVTMFPELKGRNGLDESIVPCNIGENGACYVRDIEIAALLKAMSDKGLLVTIVLDSCHSGGATRGRLDGSPAKNSAVRCVPGFIDTTPPPAESLVFDRKKPLEDFLISPSGATRNFSASGGWQMSAPENCVFIAACRANELANEYAFDGNERNGALTYWMLDALRQMGEGYTYKMLYNSVVAKVHAKFAEQTPQIEGDRDREIFGGLQMTSVAAVNVLEVNADKKQVKLNTGIAQGVIKGAQFAVFPAKTKNFEDASQRLAVVEVDAPGAAETWAKIIDDGKPEKIQPGSQAVLLGIGIRLRGRIQLVSQTKAFDKTAQTAALNKLRDLIKKTEKGELAKDKWIRLAKTDEEADFQVAVNSYGEYEIWDASDNVVPNLRPSLKIADADSATKIFERLVHLTKYRNVQLIDNTDPTSPLARKIIAELGTLKKAKKGEKSEKSKEEFIPFSVPVRPISTGEQVCLQVTNLSFFPLNIAVMDLGADWSISQIYPTDKDYELLEPGADKALRYEIQAVLPEGYQDGADTLKIFATVAGTSFRWLELDSLDSVDQPTRAAKSVLSPNGNALEELMTAFDAPSLRNFRPVINLSAPKEQNWTTANLQLRVRRPSIAHVPDPALSLLQSAFDQLSVKKVEAANKRAGKTEEITLRHQTQDAAVNLISQYCVAESEIGFSKTVSVSFDEKKKAEISVDNALMEEAQQRGIVDTAKYCASMAVGMAKNLWDAKVNGNAELYDQYKEALNQRMGNCDPQYAKALKQYIAFLARRGQIPYRKFESLDDFVIDGRLPADATVGIAADWATGEPEALKVLQQVKNHQPNVAIHLGDVYYAGTQYEVDNYFYTPWTAILKPVPDKVLSLALPGNHDLYAGGKPFYDLIDRLARLSNLTEKVASYFCLRNDHWQLIGLDTALHDRLGGDPTFLEPDEVLWLKHKFETADGRRTILLSHHQLFSANDSFDGKSYNEKFYEQIKDVLPQVDLWLWGHEHDLVIFDEFRNLKRGRCIGGSAFPVGNFEMPVTVKNPDVTFNRQVALKKGKSFFQHCYTILKLDGANATVSYYEDSENGKLLFQETL